MQIVPACGGTPNDAGLLSNGHPNLATDTTSSDWANSVFNPDINIEIGISGVAGNRKQEQQKFSGCTVDQYTMMAIGDYNSYGSTKSCTVVQHRVRRRSCSTRTSSTRRPRATPRTRIDHTRRGTFPVSVRSGRITL